MAGDIAFAIVAIIFGVVASYGLYWLLSFLVNLLPTRISQKVQVWAFLTPALVLLIAVSIAPLIQTAVWSFMKIKGKTEEWVGIANYAELFTDEKFLGILLNNFLWVLFVPAVTVAFGTLVAQLGNNVGPRREKIFKSLIFMPMSISFVAAATIWSYLYAYSAPGRPVIGLAQKIIEGLGVTEPVPIMQIDGLRFNSFLLMAVIVWLQVGYSMVIISAAIKAVPEETLEAARIDGANALQLFMRVILPQVWGSVMAVFVTVVIMVMKIFDIVLAMTRGNFNTSVLAFEWYKRYFENSDIGSASAVVMVLVVLIIPLVWLQIRTVRQQETLR
jgi:alpha-glucoside transport system permease protein